MNILTRIKLNLSHFYCYRIAVNKIHQYSVLKNPINEINRCYRQAFGCNPDLNNPQDLFEKIYWMELYTDTSLWSMCTDKYMMREYCERNGLSRYLPNLLGKWDRANDISFESLPNSFILKTNNGCGTCLVVKDKNTINERKVKTILRQWLSIPYGYRGSQLHYTRIQPCIIAEELLISDIVQSSLSPNSLIDYKVWCINGQPESILVVYNRRDDIRSVDLYDTKWNRIRDNLHKLDCCEFKETLIPKPLCLNMMLEMATTLSKPFPEVRVDFYIINNTPIIGELTFTATASLTKEYAKYLGRKIDLSQFVKTIQPTTK